MKRYSRVIESIANLGGHVPGWLVPLMMALVFFEVFMRYVVGRPPVIADEFSAYMLVALSYLGLAYTWKEKSHVRITALVDRLPPRVASWLRLVTLVIALGFVSELTYFSYVYMRRSFRLHMASGTWVHFPLQPIQMALPIGFIVLALIIISDIARAISYIQAGKNVEDMGKRIEETAL